MSSTRYKVHPAPPSSIKNLIGLFEHQSKPQKIEVAHKEISFNKPGSRQVVEVFKTLNKAKVHSLDNKTCELEERVSVKSLVCNFQKMTSERKTYTQPHRISLVGERHKFVLPPSDTKPKAVTPPKKTPKHEKTVSDSSGLFDFNKIAISTKPVSSITAEKKPEDKEPIVSKSYSVTTNSIVSETTGDDDRYGCGISNLPKNYEVLRYSQNHLELRLPSPPKKSNLKKKKAKKNSSVKFNEGREEIETYNMNEYLRADEELDVMGATAEYAFERMYERMEKISFELQRQASEPLGLQVYGVGVRTQNEKNNMAIYVKGVTPNSICEKSGMIQPDDLLIEVNGVSLIGVELSKINEAVKAGGNLLKFTVGRDPADAIDACKDAC